MKQKSSPVLLKTFIFISGRDQNWSSHFFLFLFTRTFFFNFFKSWINKRVLSWIGFTKMSIFSSFLMLFVNKCLLFTFFSFDPALMYLCIYIFSCVKMEQKAPFLKHFYFLMLYFGNIVQAIFFLKKTQKQHLL